MRSDVTAKLKNTRMKKIIALLLVISFSVNSNSQSDSLYAEIGVNAIRLIGLGLQNNHKDSDIWNPYLLTANVNYKRIGLRLGYGGRMGSRTELPTDANGKTTMLMDSSRTDFRIGLAWEIEPSAKWTFRFGVDYFIANESNLMETEFTNEDNEKVIITRDVTTDESGFAPFVCFQYHISPRISLGTELLWRFSNYTTLDRDVSNVSDTDVVREYEGSRRMVMAPTALFLNVRF
jgi:hypothetical protein